MLVTILGGGPVTMYDGDLLNVLDVTAVNTNVMINIHERFLLSQDIILLQQLQTLLMANFPDVVIGNQ
jgi:hypothetical protein